jgi:two-component system cell cycle response regulator
MVLQTLARILQRESRQQDLACRFGGEEFVLVMPDTNAAEATIVCERIRQATEATRWPRCPDLRATVSIGIAGCQGAAHMNADDWVDLVDRNLYAAKRSGRNRVISSDIPSAAGAVIRPSA